MTIELVTPGSAELGTVLGALREWQHDGSPIQLHPGDVGWFWRFGATRTAEALRCWTRGDRIVAIGLLDGATILRLTIAPDLLRDRELSERLADDLSDPVRGILAAGEAAIESPPGALVADDLAERGFAEGESWTPLFRDLTAPVQPAALRIEVVDESRVSERTAIQRSAFEHSVFTDDRWRDMASGPAYADARCLVGYDDAGTAVAAITVWGSGAGKPGLIEPMGVHRDHLGRGYGTAITLAGASALRELGASTAAVCTETARAAAIATYEKAGFVAGAARIDRSRPA